MDLNGKNVCFVAGFGGIGLESCKNLLQKGIANLAILDITENTEALDALKSEYPGKDIFALQLDVTNKPQIEERIKEVVDRLKYIDILVNGAGIIAETNPDLAVSINLLGVINTTIIALSHMDVTKGGRGGLIVNIASVAGIEPAPPIPVYCATKFGIVGFTRSIGIDYYKETTGVACIVVCPGVTLTPLVTDIKKVQGHFEHAGPLVKIFSKCQRQTAAQMGESFVQVLEQAQNGSIWICDEGEIREVQPSVYWKQKS